MGGGQAVQSVKLPPEWESLISAPAKPHHLKRLFTAKEDAFLVRMREAGKPWNEILPVLKCTADTALKRLRELQGRVK